MKTASLQICHPCVLQIKIMGNLLVTSVYIYKDSLPCGFAVLKTNCPYGLVVLNNLTFAVV